LVALPVGVKLAGGAERRQELAEEGRREFDDLTQVSSAEARRAVVCDQMDKGIRVRGIQARQSLSCSEPVTKGSQSS
jgi:predicted transcriptional regulator of viral defense system